jgi:hypothetical protein
MGRVRAARPATRSRGRRFWSIAGLILSAIVICAPAQGAAHAWSCLLYASNAESPDELPERLAVFGPRLKRSFGFSNYRLLAQHEIAVPEAAETPLLSAGDLHIFIKSLLPAPDGRYVLGLVFVEGSQQVMETQARVGRGSPLFIRGPEWREGQIIIVVAIDA